MRKGSNYCSTSPVRGVFGCASGYCNGTGGSATYVDKIFSYKAPNPNGVPSLAPGCTNQRSGNKVVRSIVSPWIRDSSPSYGAILPSGIAMARYQNGNPLLASTSSSWPSDPLCQDIAKNVADNLARTIRQDPAFDIRIHSIGYSGTGGVDRQILELIANCEACTAMSMSEATDTSQSKGRCVSAANASDLMDASLDVVGYIARITY